MESQSLDYEGIENLDFTQLEDLINDYMYNMGVEASLHDDHPVENVITQDDVNRHCPLTYIEETTECSICLRTIEVGSRMRKLECMHYFCRKCIDPYLMKKNECPNCRAKAI